MAKAQAQTKPGWIPNPSMLEAIDMQATGHSLTAISRDLDVPLPTLWSWNNELAFSEQYRAMVESRAAEFQAAKDAVHDQQVVIALGIIQQALTGEMDRERAGDAYIAPLRYEAAIKLLQGTYWKQRAGGHKQFGAP